MEKVNYSIGNIYKFIRKKWRLDIGMWESKFKFLFINIYKYSKFGDRSRYRLFPIKNSKYLKEPIGPGLLDVTKEEVDKVYNGNKWRVPVNYSIGNIK